MIKDNYNYGISLLRIISMIFITVLHIIGHGGISSSIDTFSQVALTQLIYTLCICGVNCFAIISGFVGYRNDDQKVNYSRWLYLWFQVTFYSVVISILFMICNHPDATIKQLIYSFLPVTTGQYWYFSAYTGMILIMPLINLIIKHTNKNSMLKIIFSGTAFFSFYGFFANRYSNIFDLNYGYSIAWICFLYIIGASIKKYELYKSISISKSVFLTFFLWIFSFTWKVFLPAPLDRFSSIFSNYLSPTVLGIAVCLVLIFANLKFYSEINKTISYWNQTTFSVYLIQEKNLFRQQFIIGAFAFVHELHFSLIPIVIIVSALAFFIIFSLIDHVRLFIFNLFHVKELSDKIVSYGTQKYDIICKKLINHFN